jgi:hypothetical protein
MVVRYKVITDSNETILLEDKVWTIAGIWNRQSLGVRCISDTMLCNGIDAIAM